MSSELVTQPAHRSVAHLAPGNVMAIVPQTFDEVYRFSQAISKSGLAPYGMDTPEKVMISILTGLEVGAKPMQSVQGIAVIGNRPSIWGDLALALVRQSGELEEFTETYEGSPPENWQDPKGQEKLFKAVCRVKRRGEPAVAQEFSIADAVQAKLWMKSGPKGPTPWVTNPKRMLRMRARGFSLRDTFTDVLKGMSLAEELQGSEEFLDTRESAPPASRRRSAPPVPAAGLPAPIETTTATVPSPDTVVVQDAEIVDPTPLSANEVVSTSEHDPVQQEQHDETETPDEAIEALRQKLSFAKTADEVEEFYADADLEAELSDVEGYVEKARALKVEALARVAPADKAGSAPGAAATDQPPVDPFAIPEGFDDEQDYRMWIQVAMQSVSDPETAAKLSAAWNGTKSMRPDVPVSEASTRELKAAVTRVLAKYKTAAPEAPAPEPEKQATEVDIDAVPTSVAQYEMQTAARAAQVKEWPQAQALKRLYLSQPQADLRQSLGITEKDRDRLRKIVDTKLDELRPSDRG